MPNHVKNIVKMEGITKLPLFKTEYDEYEKREWSALTSTRSFLCRRA